MDPANDVARSYRRTHKPDQEIDDLRVRSDGRFHEKYNGSNHEGDGTHRDHPRERLGLVEA
jgi:hypothetical protein